MTKSHNSCKTCSIPNSRLYGHLHVILITVYGYEQNPSRDVGGVAHTRFQDVHTDGWTYVQRSANLNALPQFCTGTAFSGPDATFVTVTISPRRLQIHSLYQ